MRFSRTIPARNFSLLPAVHETVLPIVPWSSRSLGPGAAWEVGAMGAPWGSRAGPSKQDLSHHPCQGAGQARGHQGQPQALGTFLGMGLSQDISLQVGYHCHYKWRLCRPVGPPPILHPPPWQEVFGNPSWVPKVTAAADKLCAWMGKTIPHISFIHTHST